MNWLRRIWLFVRIVWRPWGVKRLDVRTAWGISSVCTERIPRVYVPPMKLKADIRICETFTEFLHAVSEGRTAGLEFNDRWEKSFVEFMHWESRREAGL